MTSESIKIKKHLINALTYIICGIMCVVVLFPFLLVIITSVKSIEESAVVTFSLPKEWLWGNFLYVIREGKLINAFKNSIIITGASVIGTVFLSSMTAFILTRRNDKVSKFISNYFLIGMIAPLSLIPEVIIVKTLGLSGTFISIILIHIAVRLPLSIMIYSSTIKGIPRTLDESAIIDGCGTFTIFYRIIFPLLKPAIFTNVVIVFMGVWNDLQVSLYFITDIAKNTVPLSIYSFVGYMTFKWNYVCAFILLSIAPILIIYVIGQKYIVSGLIAGSVKG